MLTLTLSLAMLAFAPVQTQPDATPAAPVAPAAPATPGTPQTQPAPDPLAALSDTTPFEPDAPVLVGDGYSFTEGPCWVPAAGATPGFFVFCDVPKATVYRWAGEGKPEVFRENSGKALGTAIDAARVLYHCEVQDRRVTSVTLVEAKPGEVRVLAERFEGKRLNAPNDLVVCRDGTIYFTDPTFFTPKEELELSFSGVFRLAKDGTLTALRRDIRLPNGIALSPDERTLYVTDFGNNLVLAMDLTKPMTKLLTKPDVDTRASSMPDPVRPLEAQLEIRTVADLAALGKSVGVSGRGRADGLRVLPDGTIVTTGPGGVYALAPNGKLLGVLRMPGVANLAVAPMKAGGHQLLLTAGDKVYSARLRAVPVPKP
jgi:sugar lactone lactonase YvrE